MPPTFASTDPGTVSMAGSGTLATQTGNLGIYHFYHMFSQILNLQIKITKLSLFVYIPSHDFLIT